MHCRQGCVKDHMRQNDVQNNWMFKVRRCFKVLAQRMDNFDLLSFITSMAGQTQTQTQNIDNLFSKIRTRQCHDRSLKGQAQVVCWTSTHGSLKNKLSNPNGWPDTNGPKTKPYHATKCCWQCCGSGFGFSGVPGSRSGSRRAKMTYKNRKKVLNYIFGMLDVLLVKVSPVAWESFMKAQG